MSITEIEHRFFMDPRVGNCPSFYGDNALRITQVFFSLDPLIRVRWARGNPREVIEETSLTIKLGQGIERTEINGTLDLQHLQEALESPERIGTTRKAIRKTRIPYVANDGHIWVLDSYDDDLTGLFTGEIELPTRDTPFEIPDFVCPQDVTEDTRMTTTTLLHESAQYHLELYHSFIPS